MDKLTEIFQSKKREVEAARAALPNGELEAMVRDLPPTQGFLTALKTSPHPVSLIAEVKAASPSQGTIRADFEPAAVASAYKSAGADVLSVLTDRPYFGGAPENICLAKEASGLPALRKDFINDRYQILEARHWGADAVLLIVAALSREQLADLHGFAIELGLDVLVEVHTPEEAQIARDVNCPLIGVNNRDLSTFKTSIETTEEIMPMLAGHAHTVSESALSTNADIERVAAAGAQSVLIGTAFCGSPDIEAKVREVMGWS